MTLQPSTCEGGADFSALNSNDRESTVKSQTDGTRDLSEDELLIKDENEGDPGKDGADRQIVGQDQQYAEQGSQATRENVRHESPLPILPQTIQGSGSDYFDEKDDTEPVWLDKDALREFHERASRHTNLTGSDDHQSMGQTDLLPGTSNRDIYPETV